MSPKYAHDSQPHEAVKRTLGQDRAIGALIFSLAAIAIGVIHFGIFVIIAMSIIFHDWGPGPQGGDAISTSEVRKFRDPTEPYDDVIMSFLQVTDRVLAFPVSLTGSQNIGSVSRAIINSGLWGLAITGGIKILRKRKHRKNQLNSRPGRGMKKSS